MAMPLTIIGTAFNAAWEGIQDGEHKKLVEEHRGNDTKVLTRSYFELLLARKLL